MALCEQLAKQGRYEEMADADLLGRFVAHGDEAAFAAIVHRHHGLVFGVCRRRLRCRQDAEDAFQATFLVLAQRASKVRRPGALASWLYGVAYRVALRQSRARARAGAAPLEVPVMVHDDPLKLLAERHEQLVTDEELSALPEGLRAPLVLRYLAGKSNEEVAAELAISVAAVEGRLKRAKQKLRRTLTRRGVALSTTLAALSGSRCAAAHAAEPLIAKTIAVCLGGTAAVPASVPTELPGASSASDNVIQLSTKEVLTMTTFKLSNVAAVAVIVIGTSTLGWGLQQALSQPAEGNPFGVGASGAAALNQQGSAGAGDAENDPFGTDTVEGVAQPGGSAGASRAQTGATAEAPGTFTEETVPPETVADSTYDVAPRSAQERQIRRALDQKTTLEFFDTPLEDALLEIERRHAIPIVLDERALQDIGVDASTPITANSHNMSLHTALRLILRDPDLAYILEDEYLLITTPEEAEQNMKTRVYPIQPRWNFSPQELISTITTTVMPDSWDTVGGPGSIKSLGGNLVIMQTFNGHERVNDLLRQLDRAARMQPQQAAAAGRGTGGDAGYDMGYGGEYGSGYGGAAGGGYGGAGRPRGGSGGYGSGFGGDSAPPPRDRRGGVPRIGGDATDEGPADDTPSSGQRQ